VATAVGGNAELVEVVVTGTLVPPGSPDALAEALARYVDDVELVRAQGRAARARAEREFALDGMVARYQAVYDELASRLPRSVTEGTSTSCAG